MRNSRDAIVDLVREFYSNAEIINGAIQTYIRGTHIDVDEACILEVRQEVPRVQNPTYPPKKNVAMNLVGRELTGVADFSWAGWRFLKQGELTDKYKMLNLIAVSSSHRTKKMRSCLIWPDCYMHLEGGIASTSPHLS